MARIVPVPLLLIGVLSAMGAGYRVQTTNFLVEAPTPQIAQQVGQYAEHYRKEKAREWLGREMPPWRMPCPLHVKVTMNGAGGATTFEYGQGEVLNQHMQIEGSLDRLLASVLPHEVTHTVFAHYFRCPVPRWADEGGSVLSEDEVERGRHDRLAWQIVHTPGRAIPLRRLFSLREYPHDVMTLYAQGYSVTSFLVETSDRQTFLNFLAHGMRHGWDSAVQTYYRYKNIEELERGWVAHLRESRRPTQLAKNTAPAQGDPARRIIVRQTAPVDVPPLDAARPIVRGQSGEGDVWAGPAQQEVASRPGGLPDYPVRTGSPTVRPDPPGPVLLKAPEFGPAPPAPPRLGLPVPAGTSPVGYPR
jgi:hypothetical protein